MAKQTINIGASPNDGTGTPLRTAFDYCNLNFTELYTAVGPSGNNIVVPGSATITGALTVNTNVLKVDTTNDRVGIGTATPGVRFDILSDNNTSLAAVLRVNSNNAAVNTALAYDGLIASGGMTLQSGANPFIINTNGANERYRIAADGVATWSNVGGVAGTAMTLNANGLGIGVTPSAWGGTAKAIQIGSYSGIYNDVDFTVVVNNAFFNGTNNIYRNTAPASQYDQQAGSHVWRTAPSGTAGNAITFTQAMTLDASGNLLVGTTTSLANTSHSFQATGTTNSFWAGTFQHNGTPTNGRVLNWKLTNANDTSSYFVFANNSGGNCFNVLGNGNVQNTTGTYGTISDLRLKENISDARNYLADLLKLRVVKYSLKSESSPAANLIGLIAQEVEQVFPTLVETNGDDVKSIKTTVLIPMLLKALQELTARVQTLEAK